MEKTKINKCLDCSVKEGELHKENCDMEQCPKCKKQLLSCDCNIQDISVDEKFLKISGKPFKREPFFDKPFFCARCGELYSNLFNVSAKDWKETIGISYDPEDVLCEKCFIIVRKLRGLKKIKLNRDCEKRIKKLIKEHKKNGN